MEATGIIFIMFILLWAVPMMLAFGLLIVWVIALVDVLKREFKQESDKTTWLLVVLLCGGIGAVIYYFVVMRHPEQYT